MPKRNVGGGRIAQWMNSGKRPSRLDEDVLRFKQELWRTHLEDFFQAYTQPNDTVVDLGAGNCEFINAVSCRPKIAVDLEPGSVDFAIYAEGLLRPGDALAPIACETVDVVFASNFEHLPTKIVLVRTLEECRDVLLAGGKLIVVQPNIRYLPGRYWDYLDHHIALSHLSMTEALELNGFRAENVVPRFLPCTVKNGGSPGAARSCVPS
jgi:SAM-dependent methyltransferase